MSNTVLIVDSDRNFSHSFQRLLEQHGYHVLCSQTGTDALIYLQQQQVDAALIDLHLPDASGTEIADYIHHQFPDLPTIILTAEASLDSALHVLRSGVSDYLCKPTPPELIINSLKRCLEYSRLKGALRESEERFRQLAELSNEGIALIRDNSIQLVNRQFIDLFGRSEIDIKSLNIQELLPDWQSLFVSLRTLAKQEEKPSLETVATHHTGTSFPIEVGLQLLENKGPLTYAISILDISQRKKNEQLLLEFQDKLAKSQRMESLGLMASRVAHDLNNILSGLVSYPDLLLQKVGDDTVLREEIELIRKTGQQAGELVSDLLTIARGAKAKKEKNQLNLIVNNYRNSIEYRQLHQNYPALAIDFELDPTLPNFSSSAINITQALSNLVLNGVEACAKHEPFLRIRTTFQELEEPVHGFETIPAGQYVVLSVTDNGSGISPHSRNYIFEPFYSEKETGKSGTGLGLTIIWNTMRDHQGYINLATTTKGTRFDLYFPFSNSQELNPALELIEQEITGNGEQILVIDDEPFQREIARSTITRLGYRVKTVASGEQALNYLRSHSADLLVLDMVMESGMNGVQTFAAIKERHPHQKALVTSGFFGPSEQREISLLGISHYLHKPYSIAAIGRAIRQLLSTNG